MVKYFSFKEFEEKGYIRENGICIVIGCRDIGKTWGSIYQLIDDGRVNKDSWVAFVRNSDEEIKKFKKGFEDKYAGRYRIEGDFIYEEKPVLWINKKTGEEITKLTKGDCVGFVNALSVRGIDGTRGSDFSKVKFIICDEFNLIGKGKGLSFDKFQAFYKSVVRRRRDVKTLFIGNRDDAACDIFVNLSIEVEPPCKWEKHKGHWIHYFTGEENPQNVFINLDDREYMGEYTKQDNWRILMQSSTKSQYVNNKFLSYENIDCRYLTPQELQEVSFETKIEFDTNNLFLGKFEHLLIVHLDVNKSMNDLDVPIYSNSFENSDKYKKNLFNNSIRLYNQYKDYFTDQNKPYRLFTSIECKEIFMKLFQRFYMDKLADDVSFSL